AESIRQPSSSIHIKSDRAWKREKRIDDAHAGDLLPVLKIFSQQVATSAYVGSPHNQRIPKAELVAILDTPSLFKDRITQAERLPRQQRAYVRTGRFAIEARSQFLRDSDVELGQHLSTEPASSRPPELGHPGFSLLLFATLGAVTSVNEDVAVNE